LFQKLAKDEVCCRIKGKKSEQNYKRFKNRWMRLQKQNCKNFKCNLIMFFEFSEFLDELKTKQQIIVECVYAAIKDYL